MNLGPSWPKADELLPRAAEAIGVRDKLLRYSLDLTNEIGKPKARGFERILGITIEDVDYLESAIRAGILTLPVSTVRDNPPWGLKCVVNVPVYGLREKRGRVINVRTVWEIAGSDAPPRLVNAYLKP